MPLPKPNSGETHDHWMGRCMGNPTMNEEYPDGKQRYAVCQSIWDRKKSTEETMEREVKYIPFEVKEVDEEEGTFEGYAATFRKEPDSYGDIIDKGAFKKTIKEHAKRIKILWNHSVMEPIGKPVELREDDIGLYIKGKLSLGVQRAKEILALMKDGVITEMSIGYQTIVERFEGSGKAQIRHLKEVRLWDTSPVTFAADSNAVILNAKAAELAIRRQDLQPIEDAVVQLQALLKQAKEDIEEPDESTPDSDQLDEEAAELDETLSQIEAELGSDDDSELDAVLDAAIAKIESGG